jgi:FtsP/CotA-like multicopper oxidase with cupredoxin domain
MALPSLASASPNVLRAEPVVAQILPKGDGTTAMLGLNGSTPGPELRLRQGDELTVRFENQTDDGSSLHWHGIRLDNAMDGVPDLTQPLVPAGGSFDYQFRVPDAGTYWYHSHNRSWEQVAKGLYGPLIIEENNPPRVDHDITVMLDDWRIEETGALIGGFGAMHDFAHAGRMGNYARALVPQGTVVRQGDRIRLRLINTATARVFPVKIEGLDGRVVALDGMPLIAPRLFEDITLAPAQRIDVIGNVTGPVNFLMVARDGLYELGGIVVDGENKTPVTDAIAALPAASVAMPKEQPDHALTLKMEGGAMGGRHAGDDIWAFNGISGLPDEPWVQFQRGETVVIDLVNDTSFSHGIHLHGHHFNEMKSDGSLGDLRDTSLVEAGQSRKIAVVFDNPGKWLLHCHMLGHQASGMKTWVEVL